VATVTFNKEELQEYGLPVSGWDGVELISDVITHKSRWSVHHEIVFKWLDGKFYKAHYSEGATELQSEMPWEYEDEIECTEVHPVEKVVKVWEAV
jgi:hypothetical protein